MIDICIVANLPGFAQISGFVIPFPANLCFSRLSKLPIVDTGIEIAYAHSLTGVPTECDKCQHDSSYTTNATKTAILIIFIDGCGLLKYGWVWLILVPQFVKLATMYYLTVNQQKIFCHVSSFLNILCSNFTTILSKCQISGPDIPQLRYTQVAPYLNILKHFSVTSQDSPIVPEISGFFQLEEGLLSTILVTM